MNVVGENAAVGEKASPIPVAPLHVSNSTRGPEVRQHYVVERYDVGFSFDARGAIRKVHSRVEIRSISPNVCFYYSGHSVDEGRRAHAPKVHVLSGGTLETINSSPLGAFDMFFRLQEPLMFPGDTGALSYTIHLDGKGVADPAIMYLAPPGARRHSLRAEFTPPAVPSRLWRFAGPDTLQVEHPAPSAEMQPITDSIFEFDFDDLKAGWIYGFNWLWSEHLDTTLR